MGVGSWLGIVVAVVVIAVLVALLAMGANKKKRERDRTRADELRQQAAAQATGVEQREAQVRETQAAAERARAEAEQKKAEAVRLEAEAADRRSTAEDFRDRHETTLREADELDPDVKHEAPRTDREVPEAQGTPGAPSEHVPTQRVDEPGSHRA